MRFAGTISSGSARKALSVYYARIMVADRRRISYCLGDLFTRWMGAQNLTLREERVTYRRFSSCYSEPRGLLAVCYVCEAARRRSPSAILPATVFTRFHE
jgi:hypothetical protein